MLFPNAIEIGMKAGDSLSERLNGLSNRETERVKTVVLSRDDICEEFGFEKEYVCFHHPVRAYDKMLNSYLLFPHANCEEIADEYSLWPGDFGSDFDDAAKIEALGHNIANAAIDVYADESTEKDFDMAPPNVSRENSGDEPLSGVIDDREGLSSITNTCLSGTHEFQHVLVVSEGLIGSVPHQKE